MAGDLDVDGTVGADDFTLFAAAMGRVEGDSAFNACSDYDGDGLISFVDYQIWLQYYHDFTDRLRSAPPQAIGEPQPRNARSAQRPDKLRDR